MFIRHSPCVYDSIRLLTRSSYGIRVDNCLTRSFSSRKAWYDTVSRVSYERLNDRYDLALLGESEVVRIMLRDGVAFILLISL